MSLEPCLSHLYAMLTSPCPERSPDGTPLSDNQKKKRAKQAEKEKLKAEKAAKLQAEQAKKEASEIVSIRRITTKQCARRSIRPCIKSRLPKR